MTDTPSVTTFVVGERLPWPDDAPPLDAKGPFDLGAIHHSGSRQECAIRKISALGVTIGSDLTPALGDAVSIELANGQRAPGRVAWTGRRELGIRFDDSVDIVALLNRKLVSQTRERRTMPRLEVRCPVHLKFGGQLWPATLRNISARGVQIEGDELPPVGTFVSLFIHGLHMPAGEVLWRRDKLAGVELFEELSWTSIIPWVRGFARGAAN
jgi:hypothetical protein